MASDPIDFGVFSSIYFKVVSFFCAGILGYNINIPSKNQTYALTWEYIKTTSKATMGDIAKISKI